MKKGNLPVVNPAIILPYGLRDNELVTIDQVQSGLDCNCCCPACKNKLIAHKGPLVKNSFAHYTVADCNRGVEAALHRLCRDIIEQEKRFMLPALFFSYSWRSKIAPEKEIRVDAVKLENKTGSPVPDIVIESRGKEIVVEITVHQRASWERMQMFKNKNISGVEIHFPKMVEHLFQRKDFWLQDDSFRQELLFRATSKFWIHSPMLSGIEAFLKERYAEARTINWFKVEYGTYYYVDSCPLFKRTWLTGPKEGQKYATIEDCNHCYFCLSKYEKTTGLVYCVGHLKDTLHQLLRKAKP